MQPPDQEPPPPAPQQPPAQPPYYAPPSYAPATPSPRRSRAGVFAIIGIILVLLLVGGGYFVAGQQYAKSRLDSAGGTYNSVIEHQNGMADFFKTLSFKT